MKRTFLPLCLVVLLWPLAGHPQGTPAAPEIPHRFLFVVERSSAMKRNEAATLNTVHQLIQTGAYGAMHRGDVYTIWTFDREIHDQQFPPRVWVPEVSAALAGTARQFLKEQKYSWSAKLDPAVARVVQLAKTLPALTVFLITDGSEVLYGTPFDLEVSVILVQHAAEMAKEKRPFVITLVAEAGKIASWAVDAGGGRITVPVVAKPAETKSKTEPAPATPKPVAKVTVTPAPANPPKPPPQPEPAKPVVAEKPKIAAPSKPTPPRVTTRPVTPPPVVPPPAPKPDEPPPAPKSPATVASTPKPATVQPPVSTPPPAPPPPVPKPEPPPKAEAPAPAPVVIQPAPVQSAPPVAVPPPVPENPTVAPSLKESAATPANAPVTPAPEPVEVKDKPAAAPAPAPPPAQTAVVVPSDSVATGWRFLVMGGALLVVAALMIAAIWRRSRVPRPSLITQSLDRERK